MAGSGALLLLAGLELGRVELELLRDQDINLFIQRGMRDGIFIFIFANVSNPLVEGYDTSKPKNFIIYLDDSNLRLQGEARDAHGGADHKNKRTSQDGVDTGAGPRAWRSKQLPARAREKGNKKGADVRLPKASDGRSESGPLNSKTLMLTLRMTLRDASQKKTNSLLWVLPSPS